MDEESDTTEGSIKVGVFTRINPFKSRHKIPVPTQRAVSQEYSAGFFSLLTFSWISDLLSVGYQRPLELNDIWLINPDRNTHKLASELKLAFHSNVHNKSKRPLVMAIFKTFKPDFFIGGISSITSSMIQVLVPFVVKYLISFAVRAWTSEKSQTKAPPIGEGIGIVIAITIMQTFGLFAGNHFFYRGMILGGQVRSALISIIFDKAMTISSRAKAGGQKLEAIPPGMEPGSKEEKQFYAEQLKKKKGKGGQTDENKPEAWSNGRIVNLMSVDTHRIDQASGWFHFVWTSPLSMIVTIVLLIINLGYSAVVGIAFFLLSVPLMSVFVALLFKRRAIISKFTDKRITMMQEVLQAIRFVKYYSWEADFMQRLAAIRKQEIRSIRVLLAIRNASNSISSGIPIFASMLAFITYSLTKHSLDPAPIFSSLALFNQLRMPLILLPMVLGRVTDALQAIARIESFLLAEDSADTIELNEAGEYALEFHDASFTWEQTSPSDPREHLKQTKMTAEQKIRATQDAKAAKREVKRAEKQRKKSSAGNEVTTNSDEYGTSTPKKQPFTIENISLKVGHSELIGVVGGVGSGKSSLLSAIAGEMRQLDGTANVNGRRAYCAQAAWIQNSTICDNITFGKEYDEGKYDEIIEACSLKHDLQALPHGSLTEIGERGINLSGGQKQRVSLARAIYFDADIILLDDPLAAADAHVGAIIMDKAICGLLKRKCRILATHQLHVLHRCDRVLVMDGGKAVAFDTLDNLMAENEKFQQMMATTDIGQSNEAKEENISEIGGALEEIPTVKKAQVALMQEEERQVFGVSGAVYADYGKSTGSILVVPLIILTLGVGVYAGMGIAQALLLFVFTLSLSFFGTEASKRMLHRAAHRVVRAPVSFFDTTPLGRIMNRFSKDIDVMDNNLTESIRIAGTAIGTVISVFILVIAYYYYFAAAFFPLFFIYLFISSYYRASAREITRHEAVLRSSVFAQFNEAISGTVTIRAYGVQDKFSHNLTDAINNMDSAYYLTFANQRWLCVRLDAIGVTFLFVTGMLIVTSRFSISPSISGLVLSYLVIIMQMLEFTVRSVADVENCMNAAERIHYYGKEIPQEAAENTPVFKLPVQWPQSGQIVFKNVEMRYREGLPLILKGLDLNIQSGERLGIVGRTGAVKSSIMVALFRIVELSEGSIQIDNININTVGLHDLRSRMSIIPQDPTLFRGTVRSNLDPFSEHSEMDLWTALRQAQLVGAIPSQSDITLGTAVEAEGTNFSLGQKQLMALARALVRGSQIIVCDEATSSIDFESDRKIQATIMSGFKGKTLLCIAHRLKTVIGYHRICVIDDGKVEEIDTPLNLYDANGTFRGMCEKSGIEREEIVRAQDAVQCDFEKNDH